MVVPPDDRTWIRRKYVVVLATNMLLINQHQVDFSLLNYPTVICTVLCAYLDTFLTNRNE